MIKRSLRTLGAAALGAVALATAPCAFADDRVPLGGGSPIVVLGDETLACTLTTIGHDASGNIVGLTAGHCGELGDAVISEVDKGAGTLGVMVKKNSKFDFAVIKFNPSRVVPTATTNFPPQTPGQLTIAGISRQRPSPGQQTCKLGRTTGWTCGAVWKFDQLSHTTKMCIAQGDSGAPVMVGSTLVAMVNFYSGPPCDGPESGTNIGPILDAIGPGVGDGFTPEPDA